MSVLLEYMNNMFWIQINQTLVETIQIVFNYEP